MLEDCEVKNMNAEKLEMVSPKPKEWGEPFPLTDVQQSYWLGRNGWFALGDVSTHAILKWLWWISTVCGRKMERLFCAME